MFSNGSSPQTGPTTPESNTDEFGDSSLINTHYVHDWTTMPMDSDPNSIPNSEYINESAMDAHSSLGPQYVASNGVPQYAWLNRNGNDLLGGHSFGGDASSLSPFGLSPQPPTGCLPPEAFEKRRFSPNMIPASPEPLPSTRPCYLSLLDAPKKSRVETQVKLTLDLRDGPGEDAQNIQDWKYIRVPKTASIKQRPRSIPNANDALVLNLEVNTYCESSSDTPIQCCKACQAREEKRNSRKQKLAVPGPGPSFSEADPSIALTSDDESISPIDFTCYQMLDFATGYAPISFRVICYCRHFKERIGFVIEFILRDNSGMMVGRARTHPILITDDHKTAHLKNTPVTTADEEDIDSYPTSKRKRRAMEADEGKPQPRRRATGNSRLSRTLAPGPPFSESPLATTAPSSPSNSQSPVPKLEPSMSPPAISLFSPQLTQQFFVQPPAPQYPKIVRVVPQSGPTTGGVEATILGENFYPDLMPNACIFFGDSVANNIQYWGNSALTCIVPPSAIVGPVHVKLLNTTTPDAVLANTEWPLFTYTDNREKDIMMYVLQMLNQQPGHVQDPMQLVRSLVPQFGNNNGQMMYDNTAYGMPFEPGQFQQLIINVLSKIEDPSTKEIKNVSLVHKATGQTLLHLSASLGFTQLTKELIAYGADVDVQDTNGWSPLGFACLYDHIDCIKVLLGEGDAQPVGAGRDKKLIEVCGAEAKAVLQEFEEDERAYQALRKKSVTDSDEVESGGEGDDERVAWSDEDEIEDEPTFDNGDDQVVVDEDPPLPSISLPPPPLTIPTRLSRAPSVTSMSHWADIEPEEKHPDSPLELDDDPLASTLPVDVTADPTRGTWRRRIPFSRPSLPPMPWANGNGWFPMRGGDKYEEMAREFLGMVIAHKQHAVEHDPPPAYSASPEEAGSTVMLAGASTSTGPAAPMIVDEPPSPLSLDSPSSRYEMSRGYPPSRLHRRVPEQDQLLSDTEVNSFTYMPSSSMRVQKGKDKMLIFFWIPFLFLFFTWAMMKSVPIAFHFFNVAVRRQIPPTWRSTMLRG